MPSTSETIFFATNRNPTGQAASPFGIDFNPAHPHELRFGEVVLKISERDLSRKGTKLSGKLTKLVKKGDAKVTPYEEQLAQKPYKFGSKILFDNLKKRMEQGEDSLVYVHGYNVSFPEAVGSALALQVRLRQQNVPTNVVLFTWPSDGKKTPFKAYRNDRDDAAASGLAFSRGFQKLFDFLAKLRRNQYCNQGISLLCHSMGNFVLENTLWHLRKNIAGTLPKIFTEIILAAADVDDDALEYEGKLARLPEIAKRINIYYNRGDRALDISDLTKGNPDRLGESGPKHPLDVPSGVVNVDCTQVVKGLVEHSYYLEEALEDVSLVLRGKREDQFDQREYVDSANAYRLVG